MSSAKPKPDHPWRRGFPPKEVSDQIKRTILNPKVNNWKVGGALPPWNGRK
ncbi:hypothetical protein P4V33_01535 [Brevibacillus borstelensis]|uniref:hypothetical protein n=1 Tax=Brevibacillus borstelensis TaxID=45462 RepID=UPI002E22EE68|nr:hypothetical protein [Brevibacillus borstelensis]